MRACLRRPTLARPVRIALVRCMPLKYATLLSGLIIYCAITIVWPARSDAEMTAPQTVPITADELRQRGKELRADIDATYKQLQASHALSNTVNGGNDLTAVVLKYVSVGDSFADAEAILRAAGCVIGVSKQGSVTAAIDLGGGFLELKHTFAATLTPRVAGDFSAVNAVSAKIYVKYVPNADKR